MPVDPHIVFILAALAIGVGLLLHSQEWGDPRFALVIFVAGLFLLAFAVAHEVNRTPPARHLGAPICFCTNTLYTKPHAVKEGQRGPKFLEFRLFPLLYISFGRFGLGNPRNDRFLPHFYPGF